MTTTSVQRQSQVAHQHADQHQNKAILEALGTLVLCPEVTDTMFKALQINVVLPNKDSTEDKWRWRREAANHLRDLTRRMNAAQFVRGIRSQGRVLPWPGAALLFYQSLANESLVPFIKHSVAGDGDCMFASLALALGNDWTVHRLRTLVADAVTKDQLDAWKQMFDEARKERNLALTTEFSFMMGVDTLEKLRGIIKTNHFWGEVFSIGVLQDMLHIEIVVRKPTGERVITGATPVPPPLLGRVGLLYSGNHYDLLGSPDVIPSQGLDNRATFRTGPGIQWVV